MVEKSQFALGDTVLKVFCIAVLLQLLRHLAFCSILQYIGNWTIGPGKNIKLATIFPPRLTSSMYKTSFIFRKMTIFWGALVKLTNVLKHFQMSSVVYWIFYDFNSYKILVPQGS